MSRTNPIRTAKRNLAVRIALTVTKFLAVCAAIILLGASALYAYLWYQPLLLLNPVSRFPHAMFLACRDNHRCSAPDHIWDDMIPEVFHAGDPKAEVLRRIQTAGFSYWLSTASSEQYRMTAGMYHLLCSQYYNIELVFDSNDRLEAARSSIRATPSCV